jgi:hypothetical protein
MKTTWERRVPSEQNPESEPTRGTRRAHHDDMVDRAGIERRRERREMHVDRRKSAVDLFERLIGGVHAESVKATSDDAPPRTRRRK